MSQRTTTIQAREFAAFHRKCERIKGDMDKREERSFNHKRRETSEAQDNE